MIRPLIIYIILQVIFSNIPVFGQGVTLLPAGKGTVQINPGQIGSMVYHLGNETTTILKVHAKLIHPVKWQAITDTSLIILKAGEHKTGLINFRVPDFTPAGTYKLSFKVSGNNGTDIAAFDFTVNVQKVVKLSMEIVQSSGYVVAGSQATAKYIVSNNGNSTQTVVLEPSGCVIHGATSFQLKPDSSRIVSVSSELKQNFVQATNRSFRLSAGIAGKNSVLISKYHSFKVIPVTEQGNDLYFRFPIDASVRYLLRRNKGEFRSGFQGNIYGNGFLDVNKTRHLTFLARGPSQFNLSSLGLYDQYYAAYSQKQFHVFLGDKSYSLSPLTEMSRYGRGVQAGGEYKRFVFGGFYQQPRFYPAIKNELAVYGRYRFYKKNSVGVSYLFKKYNKNPGDAHLFSVNFNLHPLQNSLLQVELSKGIIGDKGGFGVYTNFVSNWQKVNVAATLVYAGKDYPGYYTNSLFYTVMGSWRITRKLSLSANIRQDYQNAAVDTLFGTAPYNQGYNAGVGYRFSRNMNARLYYDHRIIMDRASSKKFYYKEDLIRLFFSHRIRKFEYNVNGELGKTKNLLLSSDQFSNTYRITTNLFYHLTDWIQFGGFASFLSNNRYSAETKNSWIYGASISATLLKTLRLNVWYQNNYEEVDYYRNRSLFNANIDYKITRNHEVMLLANYALLQKQLNETDYSIQLTYTWHFGAPLKRTAQAGSVIGKIRNIGVKSVGGIIMHLNGHTVVSDTSGTFTLKNIKPGNYYLLIDRSTIGVHELPDVKVPIQVNVKDGQETYVTFGLTKAAQVEGEIKVVSTASDSTLLDEETKPGRLILELKNGKESVKVISENDGTFKFPDIRPGNWTLVAYPNGLSAKFMIEKDVFNLNLKPGEKVNIPIQLIRKERKIIFVGDNLDLSENIQQTNNK